MGRLSKVIGILMICLLLIPFVLGAASVVAAVNVNLLLLIVFLVVIVFGIGLYYNHRSKKPENAQPAMPEREGFMCDYDK